MRLIPRRMWRRLWTGIPLAVALVTMLGPPVSVRAQRQQDRAHTGQMAPQSLPDLQHAAGGLRAVIDPVTLEKVAEGDRAGMTPGTYPEALSQSLDGLTVVLRPDGSKYLDLQGRFRCGVVAGISSDGARQYCVNSGAQADAALRQTETPETATPQSALEVK